MYEVTCENCGRIGVHMTRTGAQSIADIHVENRGHDCTVEVPDATP